MRIISKFIVVFLFSSNLLFAQTTTEVPKLGLIQQLISMGPMFLMIFGIFYFLVLLPQKKQLKLQDSFLTSLKKGEQVVTSGGIVGKIASIEEGTITLEIANNTRVVFEKSHIKRRLKEG